MVLFKKIFLFIVSGFIVLNAEAQDPQFSQFYSASLYLGPSFAGATRGGRVASSYRNQWPDIPNQYNTYYLAVDNYFAQYQSGIGLFLLRDYAGSGKLTSTSVNLQYAYNFKIVRWLYVKPGIQMGLYNRSIDYSRLIFGDQLSFEGNIPVSSEKGFGESILLFDYATSLLFYSENFWLGTTFDHLPFPNESLLGAESANPMKLVVYGGVRFAIKKKLQLIKQDYISLSFIYKKQDVFKQLDVGFYWERFPVQLGVTYRGIPFVKSKYNFLNHDAVISKIGFMFERFSIGYSYDFNVSELRSFSGGAHEVSLIFLFNRNQEVKKRIKALPCPNF